MSNAEEKLKWLEFLKTGEEEFEVLSLKNQAGRGERVNKGEQDQVQKVGFH